jgi:hypothetical protein
MINDEIWQQIDQNRRCAMATWQFQKYTQYSGDKKKTAGEKNRKIDSE